MIKNTAGTITCRAYSTVNNMPVSSAEQATIAASLSCKLSLDGGTPIDLADTAATELGSGYFVFSHTASEANATTVDPIFSSTLPNVVVIPSQYDRQTKTSYEETVPVADTSSAEAIAAMIKGVGPKEVRTPNMTVVAHDIAAVQRVMERRAMTTIPTMCSLRGCIAVPRHRAYDMRENLYESQDGRDSGCGCG